MGVCVPILINLVNWARFAMAKTHQKYQFFHFFNILCQWNILFLPFSTNNLLTNVLSWGNFCSTDFLTTIKIIHVDKDNLSWSESDFLDYFVIDIIAREDRGARGVPLLRELLIEVDLLLWILFSKVESEGFTPRIFFELLSFAGNRGLGLSQDLGSDGFQANLRCRT